MRNYKSDLYMRLLFGRQMAPFKLDNDGCSFIALAE